MFLPALGRCLQCAKFRSCAHLILSSCAGLSLESWPSSCHTLHCATSNIFTNIHVKRSRESNAPKPTIEDTFLHPLLELVLHYRSGTNGLISRINRFQEWVHLRCWDVHSPSTSQALRFCVNLLGVKPLGAVVSKFRVRHPTEDLASQLSAMVVFCGNTLFRRALSIE